MLAPNHISYLDPIILGVAVKRKVYSMAKEELFKSGISRFFLIRLNAFPVKRRSIDRDVLKRSLQILGKGNVLNIFLEGTIPLHDKMKEGKPGVAWLALKRNVPVIPVRITGSDELLPDGAVFPKMGRARIVFGHPIYFDFNNGKHKENIKIMTGKIIEEIGKL